MDPNNGLDLLASLAGHAGEKENVPGSKRRRTSALTGQPRPPLALIEKRSLPLISPQPEIKRGRKFKESKALHDAEVITATSNWFRDDQKRSLRQFCKDVFGSSRAESIRKNIERYIKSSDRLQKKRS